MKRSIGLTLVGVLILVLSTVMLIAAVLGCIFILNAPVPAQTVPNAPPPDQMRAASSVGFGLVGVMALFGASIGVGILRLWSWARYTAIVIGFLVAGMSVLTGLIVFMMPIPEPPGTAPGLMGQIRIGMAIFYLFWAVLYAFISIYLLRSSVTEQFRRGGDAQGSAEQDRKPIAVLTVAAFTLVALLGLPYLLFVNFPVLFFGMEFGGGAGKLVLIVWILLFGAIGIALIRRVRTALWLAIGLYGLGIVNALMGFRDGVFERYYQHLPKYGAYDPHFPAGMLRMAMLMGIFSAIVPIALLLIGKKKYFAWCDRKQLVVAPPVP